MPDSEQSTQDAERIEGDQPSGDGWASRMLLAKLELRSLGAVLGSGGAHQGSPSHTEIGCPWEPGVRFLPV